MKWFIQQTMHSTNGCIQQMMDAFNEWMHFTKHIIYVEWRFFFYTFFFFTVEIEEWIRDGTVFFFTVYGITVFFYGICYLFLQYTVFMVFWLFTVYTVTTVYTVLTVLTVYTVSTVLTVYTVKYLKISEKYRRFYGI